MDKAPERENWTFRFEEEAARGAGGIWGLRSGHHVELVPWVGGGGALKPRGINGTSESWGLGFKSGPHCS